MTRNPHEIATIITVMMSMYYTADENAELRQSQFKMLWLPLLKEFAPDVVNKAFLEWQAGPSVHQRPLPGEIARLCAEIVNNDRERQLLLTSRRRELPADIAKLWEGDPPGAREAAIAAQQEKYRLADEWRVQQAAAVAGKVTPPPVEKPKRPTPQHILDRDAARTEAQRQALALDRTLAAADRFAVAEHIKTIPLDPDEELSPADKEALRREQILDAAE